LTGSTEPDSIKLLRRICTECNGSVVLSELTTAELLLLARPELMGLVHTIAGMAIVTAEGWAAISA